MKVTERSRFFLRVCVAFFCCIIKQIVLRLQTLRTSLTNPKSRGSCYLRSFVLLHFVCLCASCISGKCRESDGCRGCLRVNLTGFIQLCSSLSQGLESCRKRAVREKRKLTSRSFEAFWWDPGVSWVRAIMAEDFVSSVSSDGLKYFFYRYRCFCYVIDRRIGLRLAVTWHHRYK